MTLEKRSKLTPLERFKLTTRKRMKVTPKNSSFKLFL